MRSREQYIVQGPESLAPAQLLALVVGTGAGGRSASEISDALLERFYRERLGPWWPSERALVDDGYRDVAFPFETLPMPELTLEADWDLAQLGGYLSTWSAYRRCRAETGLDPLPGLLGQLAMPWGDPSQTRRVRWPLHLRVGRA